LLCAGHVSLNESYAQIENGEVILQGLHITPYEYGNVFNHEPVRPRRLLLHKNEIRKLFGLVSVKGNTLIPLRIYAVRGRIKIELGLCKGKQTHDKRETIRRRTADRETARTIAEHQRR